MRLAGIDIFITFIYLHTMMIQDPVVLLNIFREWRSILCTACYAVIKWCPAISMPEFDSLIFAHI